MKVAVLGASGRAGSEIIREAASRGHEVVAIARHPDKIEAGDHITPHQGDASEPETVAPLLKGCDAVISALTFDVSCANVLACLRQGDVKRLIVTGGAASLKDENDVRLIDRDDFPDFWRNGAQGGIDFFYALKDQADDIDWVFFSPAFNFEEGPRTGSFRLGKEHVIRDAEGKSRISFADYAIAMVDELEKHDHSQERFTIGY